MADDKGRWRERWHYRQVMRDNGAWPHRVALPTKEDYRRWLVVNTEGPVHALPRGQTLEQWTEYRETRAAQLAERQREPMLASLDRLRVRAQPRRDFDRRNGRSDGRER
jgi:hypothetical protein